MSREEFQQLKSGAVKRKVKRQLALFIDGTGLDRATRRLERKVDLSGLVAGVSSGLVPTAARYYTLVPYEDDARQFAFLDAVERAGLEVMLKRLPPKGVKRQVSLDVHIAADLVAFSCGKPLTAESDSEDGETKIEKQIITPQNDNVKRIVVVVCPTREMSYAIYLANSLGAETHLADFGLYGTSDGWKGVDRWIDLSNSETIWRA